MRTKKPGFPGRLLSKVSTMIKAARSQRRGQEAAAARLRAVSVLPTRPGRLLRF